MGLEKNPLSGLPILSIPHRIGKFRLGYSKFIANSFPAAKTPLGIFVVPGYGNLTRSYSLVPAVKGGSGTRLFTLSGSLPGGLSFNAATGEISGTPTSTGTFSSYSISVRDHSGTASSQSFNIIIGDAPTTISPSGDTTGATDIAAVNAALAAGDSVVLSGNYFANAAIVQPGNTAIYADSGSWKLANASNCNIWLNTNQASQTRTDQNFAVIGAGPTSFFFDGNGANQTRQTNLRSNQAFVGISIKNAVFRGFKVGAQASVMQLLGAQYASLSEVEFAQTNINNTDGLDLGGGNSFIRVANITGTVYDDCFSFFAKNKQSTTMMAAGTPWEAGADISNIYISNIVVACNLDNMFRLQAGNGFTLTGIYADTIQNTASSASKAKILIQTGEITYLDSSANAPGYADISDIVIDGATGFDKWLRADTSCSDIHVYNIVQDRAISSAVSSDETGSPAVYNVSFNTVTDTSGGGHGTLIATSSSANYFVGLHFTDVSLDDLTALINASRPIQSVIMTNVTIAGGTAPTLSSTFKSYGTFTNVTLAGEAIDTSSAFDSVLSTVFTDDFNRATANLDGATGWHLMNGSVSGLVSTGTALKQNNTDNNGTAVGSPDLGSLDHYVQALNLNTSGTGGGFIAVRLMDYKNYIGARYNALNTQWEVYSNINGTLANIGTFPDSNASQTFRLEVMGTSVTLKVSGTAVITGTAPASLISQRTGAIARHIVISPWIDDYETGTLT